MIDRIDKADIWIGIRAASVASGIGHQAIRKACREGSIPCQRLESRGQGDTHRILMRLSDFELWAKTHSRRLPGRPFKSVTLLEMILDGRSVEAICNEMGMTRTAVLRAWQRECKRNPRFPQRDRRTDRAVSVIKLSRSEIFLESWDADEKQPNLQRLSSALDAVRKSTTRLKAVSS